MNVFNIYNADMAKIDTAMGKKSRIVLVPYGQELPETAEEDTWYLKQVDAAATRVALYDSGKKQISLEVSAKSVMAGGRTLEEVLEGLAEDSLATDTEDGLMSAAQYQKLENIEAGAQKNAVTSVSGRTGAVTVKATDIFSNGIVPMTNGGHGGVTLEAALENLKLKKAGYGAPQSAAIQYQYLSELSFFTKGMMTQAFLEAMPAHSSVIAIGNDQANFSDAPTTYGLYQFIKGSNDNYMVGKCFGIGLSGEYYYAWSTANGNGLGWAKNARTAELAAYVPRAGVGYDKPITGPLYIDSQGEGYVGRMGTYHGTGSGQDFFNFALVSRGTNTAVNQFNIYPDGSAAINEKTVLTSANVDQTLWSGSWSKGNITVPNFSRFNLFKFTFEDSGTTALIMKHGKYIRGIGGYVQTTGDSVGLLAFTGSYSGNTLTFSYAQSVNVITGNYDNRIVSSIIGII